MRLLRRTGGGWASHKLYDQFKSGGKIRKRHPADRFATLDPLRAVVVRGDVNVTVYDYEWGGANTKICGAWFNTAFVNGSYLVFDLVALDGAAKKKGLSPHFKLEIYLREVDDDGFDEDLFATDSESSSDNEKDEDGFLAEEEEHEIG